MTTKNYITISAGPSREELLDSFKYAFDRGRELRVTFTGMRVVERGGVRRNGSKDQFTARIIGIKHDDGSGLSFILEAYVSLSAFFGRKVKFHYSAKTRTGHIHLA